MKPLDLETLTDWEEYRKYMKASLKSVQGDGPAYISKDKLDFQDEGKAWSGHAILLGERAVQSVSQLRKDQITFREGRVNGSQKELELSGFSQPKLIKEAAKTLKRLKLGCKVAGVEDEEGEDAAPAPAASAASASGESAGKLTPERRKEISANLARMVSDIDRLTAAL
jgi:hypothetical protein